MPESIQHKPTYELSAGFAFDDDGQRVPIVPTPGYDEPDALSETEAYQIRAETITRLLARLIEPETSEEIGHFVVFMAYVLKTPGAPTTQKELAAKCGMSAGWVSEKLQKMKLENDLIAKICDM